VEKQEPNKPMFPEVNDPDITDAQLGALVRRYEGLIRPPLVVQVRPRWFDVAQVIAVMLVAGALVVGAIIQLNATYGNRQKGTDVVHILCDKGRIGGVQSQPDYRTKQICEKDE
jgi:hypothetical protein